MFGSHLLRHRGVRSHALADVVLVAAVLAGGLCAGATGPAVASPPAPVGTIHTVLGTTGDGGPATSALLSTPLMTTDAAGNIIISDQNRIRRIDIATGVITSIAGTGIAAASGDGGPALDAALSPAQVAVAANGDLYIGDSDNKRVRKIDAATGIITTVAGNGVAAFSGDNGPATSASLQSATGVALDGLGNLFIADLPSNRIRKVVLSTGIITTIAGTGVYGYNGDNQPAVAAQLGFPYSLTVDGSNNLYVVERGTNRIRRIDAGGTITTVAGTGSAAFNGDGPAATTNLNAPGVLQYSNGSLIFSEPANNMVRRVDLASATVVTFAGTGVKGSTGDGGAASSATLDLPFGVAVGPTGSVYIAGFNGRIRAVVNGTIDVFAGVGAPFAGDGGPGTSAIISGVPHLAVDRLGNVYLADSLNGRVRKLNVASGIVTTVAGTGNTTFNGDGPAATTNLYPTAVAVDAQGDVYIADTYSGRIRKLTVATGMISTVAGTGDVTANGDGPATTTNIFPNAIAFDAAGDLLFADYQNIRKLAIATNMITTIAGTASNAFNGDGPVATTNIAPTTLVSSPDGSVYFTEQSSGRIRRLSIAAGTITTVAGTGTTAFNGDGPAGSTNVGPASLSLDTNGDLYVADPANNRIRVLRASDHTLNTIAGSVGGFSGDGGPAIAARLNYPEAVVLDGFGNLYVADSANYRVRSIRLSADAPTPPTYQPVVPERLLDTRSGVGAAAAKLVAGGILEVQITGAGQTSIPADAAAAVLNVTVTGPEADGYLTVWPCGSPQPLASNLNYYKADDTIANLVIAKVGVGGKVCIMSQATTHVVADINGWFPAGAAYNPVSPERLLDTRTGVGAAAGALAATDTLVLQVTGAGQTNVPADATAVVVNVTVAQPNGPGYLTVWPCGQPKPLASNLNYAAGQTIPNLVISRLGTGGTICISGQRDTHVIADINGWFPAGADFTSVYPERLLDTRYGVGAPEGAVPAESVLALRVTGAGVTSVPVDASAVAINVTVTGPALDGFLTVWPCGTPRPLASNVNFRSGQTIPNLVIAKLGVGGAICMSGQTDLQIVADVTGWF